MKLRKFSIGLAASVAVFGFAAFATSFLELSQAVADEASSDLLASDFVIAQAETDDVSAPWLDDPANAGDTASEADADPQVASDQSPAEIGDMCFDEGWSDEAGQQDLAYDGELVDIETASFTDDSATGINASLLGFQSESPIVSDLIGSDGAPAFSAMSFNSLPGGSADNFGMGGDGGYASAADGDSPSTSDGDNGFLPDAGDGGDDNTVPAPVPLPAPGLLLFAALALVAGPRALRRRVA